MDICKDKDLTLEETDYIGHELRTDGFYYGYINTDFQGTELYEILIFNKNGVIMLPGTSELENMESYIMTIANSNHQGTKFVWGLFNIDINSIKIEHWISSPCGHPVLLRSGEILDNTTFVIKKEILRDREGTSETDVNQTFHFRQLDIKPDSTNNFLK